MKAMVLAAGLGTRLQPLTALRAKPAIPFLNRPFLQYSLELLRRADVEKIVINLHHLPETITEAVREISENVPDLPPLIFSHEEQILGTAGALAKARDLLDDDTVVVCNGKIYFEEDLEAAARFHRECRAAVTLVLVPYTPEDPYHPVFMDAENNITGFSRGYDSGRKGSPYIFTGIHFIEPEVFKFIPEGPSDTIRDVYPKMMEKGLAVRGFVSRKYWCEASTPALYLQKSFEVLARQEPAKGAKETERAIMGKGVEIGGGTLLEDCIIWDDVSVGENSSLVGVIISSGSRLASETHLRNAIVSPVRDHLNPEVKGRAWQKNESLIWPL